MHMRPTKLNSQESLFFHFITNPPVPPLFYNFRTFYLMVAQIPGCPNPAAAAAKKEVAA